MAYFNKPIEGEEQGYIDYCVDFYINYSKKVFSAVLDRFLANSPIIININYDKEDYCFNHIVFNFIANELIDDKKTSLALNSIKNYEMKYNSCYESKNPENPIFTDLLVSLANEYGKPVFDDNNMPVHSKMKPDENVKNLVDEVKKIFSTKE